MWPTFPACVPSALLIVLVLARSASPQYGARKLSFHSSAEKNQFAWEKRYPLDFSHFNTGPFDPRDIAMIIEIVSEPGIDLVILDGQADCDA